MSQLQVEDVVNRPLAQFPTDIWGDTFINFSDESSLRLQKYSEEIEPPKEEARMMLMDDSISVAKKMNLIDTVAHLGISYFYEEEIKILLDGIFEELAANNFEIDGGLCETAIQFRILRQHGYKVPCDVFNSFIDGQGKFEERLKCEIRGIVSLYEAAQLRVHGEDVLEEAFIFATNFLELVAKSSELAQRALKYPLHHTMLRVETHHFISVYEEDESHNETLLRLAKMDFNRLQLLHRKELSQLQQWWKNFTTELPYVRNRSVESHFTANGMYFEPQYSVGRVLVAKVVLLATVLDDAYDAYGTPEELQRLTHAFERWNSNAMDQLSDNMKLVYKFTIDLYEELAQELIKRDNPLAAQFVKETVKDLVKAYMEKVNRRETKYTPTYEDYMVEGRITSLAPLLLVSSLIGMDEVVDVKPFQLIRQAPKPIRACELFCRVVNDIYSHEEEQARGVAASSVECYMKQYGKNTGTTVEIFKKILENVWKDMNEGFILTTNDKNPNEKYDGKNQMVPKHILKVGLNLCRVVDVFYKGGDGYTHPAKVIKDHVTALYAQLFLI